MSDGSVVKPTDPFTVFNAVWDLREVRYEAAIITFRIITDNGREQTVQSVPDRRDGQFQVCTIWDYTDEARYIIMTPKHPESENPRQRMLEAGDSQVAFRNIGTHRNGPDDLHCYRHERERVHTLEVMAIE